MEKYISFTISHLRFIDSCQFMVLSLEKLVKNLDKFPHLGSQIQEVWGPEASLEEVLPLLTQKGIYPYSYMDSFSKFEETSLPPKAAFFNDLIQEEITDEEYEHAQIVWEKMGCTDMGDYHDVYLITDTLLLADVFENFRAICLETYELDPAHYYTAPGLAWDAALKFTQIELDTLTDIDHHLFIEAGLRGGISMVTHRFAKANNSFLEDYDETKQDSHIIYLDSNNLYGWAMSQPLPVSDFQWVDEIEDFNVNDIPDDSETGYILEVDLTYPQHLHDGHNHYPLAPEHLKIKPSMLSPYSTQLAQELQLKPGSVSKLVPNLYNKEKYILHLFTAT